MVSTPSRRRVYENPTKLPVQGSEPAKPSLIWDNTTLPTTPLFGTDGIRGKVGDLLNPSLALQVGFWAGKILQQSRTQPAPVIMGQDTRNSGDLLATALASGLKAAGLEVWNLGVCPTPCVAYLTRLTGALGGVMISASHNPPQDNGIKFFGNDGTKLPAPLQQQIEAGVRSSQHLVTSHLKGVDYHYRPELVRNYTESLHSPLLPTLNFQGMKVVLDLAWGAAVHIGPDVFEAMGAEVICLHDRPDGDQINVNCGSTHLHHLQQAVQHHEADLGFAFDGDADRVLAVDNLGRPVDGDYILFLWGQALKAMGRLPENLIVSTVMANLGFETAWTQQGGQLLRTAVGDQYVHAEMQRAGAMLGGEQSGHILCPHYGITGDGLLTALHIAALVKRSGVSLATLVDQSFQTYPQLLRNVRVEDLQKRRYWQDCEPLRAEIEKAETAMGDQGRVLVRASGTEPLIRVMVEAADADLANYWTNYLVLAVQQYLG